jgi:hypothetical protein
MNLLVRVALLAYPRSFRRHYGAEWARTIADLQTYSHRSGLRVAGTVISDALTIAFRMRWDNLTTRSKTMLSVVAATLALAAAAMGSEAVAIFVLAIVALLGLQLAGKDRPIAAHDPSITRRWYIWLAAAVGLYLLGFVFLAFWLTEVGWAIWMLSWAAATVVGLLGLGLGAAHLFVSRRSGAQIAR